MLLESLNPQQLAAVTHRDGPLLVVAGAGSGKTRVITSRIAHLIREHGVGPDNILAITFTNKAADEMKERVRRLIDFTASAPWISTFHSFCLRILRRHITALGFSTDFVIYDAQDQLSLVKEAMKTVGVDKDSFPPRSILNHISGFKNDFLFPEEVDLESLPYGARYKAAEVYPVYQERLRKNNALDFDDLLIATVRLFRREPETLDHYSRWFRHILVDEFQDTNATQYQLIRLLCLTHKNVCAVGDDDQSIYRWRGANLENILHFERDFPGTVVIKLEQNYRSTQNILKAAGGVVRENVRRKPKTLWTLKHTGAPIVYYRAEDENDEAQKICDRVLELNRNEGISFNEMAVLYRTNAQSRVIEDVLRKIEIPYQLIGGQKFYERKEIKDILAYVRVVLNPSDEVSLKRIINVPPRGIGKTTLEKIEAFCPPAGISFLEGLRRAGADRIVVSAAGHKVSQFVGLMDQLREIYESRSPLEFLREVLGRTGYAAALEKENTLESRSRLENLEELFSAVEQAGEEGRSFREFLDSTTLAADSDMADDSRGMLFLMTLHTCKGLEFDSVFIVGLENGLLPHASSMSDNAEYEEERRLCYVGFTRAKERLFISNARRRRIYGNTLVYPPSDFLSAVPGEVLVTENSPLRDNFPAAFSAPVAPAPGSRELPFSHAGAPYPVGTKVLHPKFGTGVIINREGDDADLKLDIFFKQPHGKKRLAVRVAQLIVL